MKEQKYMADQLNLVLARQWDLQYEIGGRKQGPGGATSANPVSEEVVGQGGDEALELERDLLRVAPAARANARNTLV